MDFPAKAKKDFGIHAVDYVDQFFNYKARDRAYGVIVENHGGYSSDGKSLAKVIKHVGNPYFGTLPDFDNFCLE